MNSPRQATRSPIRDHADLVAAIRALRSSLRILDHGIEPDLAEQLNEVARIAEYGAQRLPGAMVIHCRELETRLWELACCDVPASVGDYDIFLELLGRIELAAHAGGAARPESPDPLPVMRSVEQRVERLSTRPDGEGLTLTVPRLDDAVALDRLLEDLTVLWEVSPRDVPWTIDCGDAARVPLALLAHLVDLRLLDGRRPRRMRLIGFDHDVRSAELGELLTQHFESRVA